jgi:hypothetical protein
VATAATVGCPHAAAIAATSPHDLQAQRMQQQKQQWQQMQEKQLSPSLPPTHQQHQFQQWQQMQKKHQIPTAKPMQPVHAAATAKGAAEAAPVVSAPAVLSSLWDHYRNGVAKMIEQDKAFVREQARAELADQRLIASCNVAGVASSDEEASLSDSPGRLSDTSSAATEGEAVGDSAQSPPSLSSSAANVVTTGRALNKAEAAVEAKVKKQIEEIDARSSTLATIIDSDKFKAAQARGEVRGGFGSLTRSYFLQLN